jgi:uncharacterized protein with FMN-binding domain
MVNMLATSARLPVLLVTGAGLLGVLAACAPASTSSSASDTTTSASGYTDGSYTADGSYQAPSGTETITVTLTLSDDAVTAVAVKGHATDPEAVEFQEKFASGIQAAVVGKKVDEINVSRVAGSSLTSSGFNTALASIKSDAAA